VEAARPDPPEPLAEPIQDFTRPLELLQERARTSYGSLARVETKIATVFAAAVAVLGLAISKDSSPLDLGVTLLYLIPLAILMNALGVREYSIVPDAETLGRAWPYYPKQTITAVFDATKIAVEELSTNVGVKAKRFKLATYWLYGLTMLIIVVRLGESTTRSFGLIPPAPLAQLTGLISPTAQPARSLPSGMRSLPRPKPTP